MFSAKPNGRLISEKALNGIEKLASKAAKTATDQKKFFQEELVRRRKMRPESAGNDTVGDDEEEDDDDDEDDEELVSTTTATTGSDSPHKEKPAALSQGRNLTNLIQRTIWTFIMMFGFMMILAAGHIWTIGLVTFIQIAVFREIITIANKSGRTKNVPFFKTTNWYFLFVTLYYAYGESVFYYLKHIVLVDKILAPFAEHHRFISFVLYLIGFVFFVMTLHRGYYKKQFREFCWTHMTILLVIGQAHFVINNILEGMFWFVVPAMFVICNDISAYICGKLFGRTPLIELSPKKTVEGFVGAWALTVMLGSIVAELVMQSHYFICPAKDLDANFFSGVTCTPNPVFLPQVFHVPKFLPKFGLIPEQLIFEPIRFHVIILSSFASLIAPFGGFFASGLKRAFKVKDFGDSIPGHGGITDRMDCQFLNGFFVSMYYHSFITTRKMTVGNVLELAIQSLTFEDQAVLATKLVQYLSTQNSLDSGLLHSVDTAVHDAYLEYTRSQ